MYAGLRIQFQRSSMGFNEFIVSNSAPEERWLERKMSEISPATSLVGQKA